MYVDVSAVSRKEWKVIYTYEAVTLCATSSTCPLALLWLKHTLYSGTSRVKSVQCQLIQTFVFSSTAPVGNVEISSVFQYMCERNLAFFLTSPL